MQIQHWPADDIGIVKPVDPQGIGHGSFEVSSNWLSVLTLANQLSHIGILGEKRKNMGYQQMSPGRFRRSQHLIALLRSQRHGFLAQNMTAVLQGGHGCRGMHAWWQAQVDQVNGIVSKQFAESGVPVNAIQLDVIAGWSKIPLDTRPVSGSPLGIATANRRYLGAGHVFPRQPVNPAHKTDAGNSNSHLTYSRHG
jgi:hypothetical protein